MPKKDVSKEIIVEVETSKEVGFLWDKLTSDQRIRALEYVFRDRIKDHGYRVQFAEDIDMLYQKLQLKKEKPDILSILTNAAWVIPVILDKKVVFGTPKNKFEVKYREEYNRKTNDRFNRIPLYINYNDDDIKMMTELTIPPYAVRYGIRHADLETYLDHKHVPPRVLMAGEHVKLSGCIIEVENAINPCFRYGLFHPTWYNMSYIEQCGDTTDKWSLNGVFYTKIPHIQSVYSYLLTAQKDNSNEISFNALYNILLHPILSNYQEINSLFTIKTIKPFQDNILSMFNYIHGTFLEKDVRQQLYWTKRIFQGGNIIYALAEWLDRTTGDVKVKLDKLVNTKKLRESLDTMCKSLDVCNVSPCESKATKCVVNSNESKIITALMSDVQNDIGKYRYKAEKINNVIIADRQRLEEEKKKEIYTDQCKWAIIHLYDNSVLKDAVKKSKQGLSIIDTLQPEMKKDVKKFIDKIITSRMEFKENNCKHFVLRSRYDNSDNIHKHFNTLRSLLNTYEDLSAKDDINKEIKCNLCGFNIACEHEKLCMQIYDATVDDVKYNLYKELFNNYYISGSVSKEEESIETANKIISCRYCGQLLKENPFIRELASNISFDEEGSLAIGHLMESENEKKIHEIFNTVSSAIRFIGCRPRQDVMIADCLSLGAQELSDIVEKRNVINKELYKDVASLAIVYARFLVEILYLVGINPLDQKQRGTKSSEIKEVKQIRRRFIESENISVDDILDTMVNFSIPLHFHVIGARAASSGIRLRDYILLYYRKFSSLTAKTTATLGEIVDGIKTGTKLVTYKYIEMEPIVINFEHEIRNIPKSYKEINDKVADYILQIMSHGGDDYTKASVLYDEDKPLDKIIRLLYKEWYTQLRDYNFIKRFLSFKNKSFGRLAYVHQYIMPIPSKIAIPIKGCEDMFTTKGNPDDYTYETYCSNGSLHSWKDSDKTITVIRYMSKKPHKEILTNTDLEKLVKSNSNEAFNYGYKVDNSLSIYNVSPDSSWVKDQLCSRCKKFKLDEEERAKKMKPKDKKELMEKVKQYNLREQVIDLYGYECIYSKEKSISNECEKNLKNTLKYVKEEEGGTFTLLPKSISDVSSMHKEHKTQPPTLHHTEVNKNIADKLISILQKRVSKKQIDNLEYAVAGLKRKAIFDFHSRREEELAQDHEYSSKINRKYDMLRLNTAIKAILDITKLYTALKNNINTYMLEKSKSYEVVYKLIETYGRKAKYPDIKSPYNIVKDTVFSKNKDLKSKINYAINMWMEYMLKLANVQYVSEVIVAHIVEELQYTKFQDITKEYADFTEAKMDARRLEGFTHFGHLTQQQKIEMGIYNLGAITIDKIYELMDMEKEASKDEAVITITREEQEIPQEDIDQGYDLTEFGELKDFYDI